jgi:hypothetical protein
MLKIVSKTTKRKEGFYQARFRDKKSGIQILLHHCLASIVLDCHKHLQVQYQYRSKENDIVDLINNDINDEIISISIC